jgi:hypothetical protein
MHAGTAGRVERALRGRRCAQGHDDPGRVARDHVQVAFDWDDDHLHVFAVVGRRYADPFFGLNGCGPAGQGAAPVRRDDDLCLRPRRLVGSP